MPSICMERGTVPRKTPILENLGTYADLHVVKGGAEVLTV